MKLLLHVYLLFHGQISVVKCVAATRSCLRHFLLDTEMFNFFPAFNNSLKWLYAYSEVTLVNRNANIAIEVCILLLKNLLSSLVCTKSNHSFFWVLYIYPLKPIIDKSLYICLLNSFVAYSVIHLLVIYYIEKRSK